MRSRAVLFDPVAPNRRRFRGRPSTSHPIIITECGFHCRTGLKIDAGIIDEGRDAPVPAAAAAPTSAPWTTPIRTGAFGRARCLFGKDLVASGATKGFELKLEILIAVTDPGIADPHGCPIFSKGVRGIPFCEAVSITVLKPQRAEMRRRASGPGRSSETQVLEKLLYDGNRPTSSQSACELRAPRPAVRSPPARLHGAATRDAASPHCRPVSAAPSSHEQRRSYQLRPAHILPETAARPRPGGTGRENR